MENQRTKGAERGSWLVTLAAFGAAAVSPLATGCAAPADDPSVDGPEAPAATTPATAQLLEIMRALGDDMVSAANGIWVEDTDAIAAAARRIADHPKVNDAQRETIQALLGAEFGTFVSFDQAVHAAAVELADAAASGVAVPDLLEPYVRMQEGCVGCHAAFRTDVATALANPETP